MASENNRMLADALRDYLLESTEPQALREIRIGKRYAAVRLEDGSAGIAFSFIETEKQYDLAAPSYSRLNAAKRTSELFKYLGSPNLVESAVSLAAANAIVNRLQAGMWTVDVLEMLVCGRGDRVGMVGYFQPMIAPLKEKVKELVIFEQRKDFLERKDVLPPEEMPAQLGTCDIALITASSLVNGTLEGVLTAAKACREKVLLGASTPLIPDFFRHYGVTMLSGVLVTDAAAVLETVSRGGGTRDVRTYTRKVTLKTEKNAG